MLTFNTNPVSSTQILKMWKEDNLSLMVKGHDFFFIFYSIAHFSSLFNNLDVEVGGGVKFSLEDRRGKVKKILCEIKRTNQK